MRIACGIIVIVLTSLYSYPVCGEIVSVKETIHFDETPRIVRLEHEQIISSSMQINLYGERLPGDDYLLDVPSGTIKFLTEISPPVDIEFRYAYLSLDLPSCYFKRKLLRDQRPATQEPSSVTERSLSSKLDSRKPSKLRVFGSKSFGVTTGTGTDLELNQTLNIRIEGHLTDELKVTGVLSDQARPEAGGISTSLGEIDKITLQISSRVFTGTIGDIDFERRVGADARFRKALKGAGVAVKANDVNADATVGGIKSRHGRVKTSGRDGVSGPYALKANNGRASISVLPGTERVWLDGRTLTRGVDADYQIDYVQGEVTFSPRIAITSRSRIEVDFEYLDESYRQDFYSGYFSYGDSASIINTEIGYIGQVDSKDNPSQFDLATTDIDVLTEAGDSAGFAVRSGIVKVDSGDGDYIQQIVDSDTIYTYVGAENGDYRVSFSYIGPGDGDYRYIGGGVYDYVSKGGGDFMPVVVLPLPQRSDVFSISSRASVEAARISFQAMLSNHDRNLFSSTDDENNTGSDVAASVTLFPLRKQREGDLGWEIGLGGRRSDTEFHIPGRAYRVDRDRTWGLESDTVLNIAEQLTVFQKLSVGSITNVEGEWGVYRDRDFRDADRYGYSAELKPRRSLSLRVSRNDRTSNDVRRETSSRLYENSASAGWRYSRFALTAGWSDETDLRMIDTLSTGRRFDRYHFGGSYRGFASRFSYEVDDISRDRWQREFDSRDVTVEYSGNGGLSESRADLSLTHRRVHRFVPETTVESYLSSTVDYRAGSSKSLFDVSLSYRVSRTGIDRTGENFVRVGKGEGDYRLENGVYVSDPLGDYIRVIEVLDVADVGVNLSRGMRLRTRPSNWAGCPDRLLFLKSISLETHFRTSEQGGAGERFSAEWLLPFAGVFPDSRFNFERTIRQTVKIDFTERLSLFVSLDEMRGERPRQIPSSSDYRLALVERVEVIIPHGATLSIEHRFKRADQDSRSFGNASFIEHRVGGSARYGLRMGLELIARPAYLVDMSRVDDLKATMLEAAFEVNQKLFGNGRASMKFAYQNVESSGGNRFLPYQYAGGRRLGDNFQWGASMELRFSRNISVRASYDGEKVPQLDTRHVSTLSVRARF